MTSTCSSHRCIVMQKSTFITLYIFRKYTDQIDRLLSIWISWQLNLFFKNYKITSNHAKHVCGKRCKICPIMQDKTLFFLFSFLFSRVVTIVICNLNCTTTWLFKIFRMQQNTIKDNFNEEKKLFRTLPSYHKNIASFWLLIISHKNIFRL